jgi:hypothetical protein
MDDGRQVMAKAHIAFGKVSLKWTISDLTIRTSLLQLK